MRIRFFVALCLVLAATTSFSQTNCEIFHLTVQTGDCTSNTSYQATISFEVQNPSTNQFELWANGTSQGLFNLSALPLTLNNFPYNGGPNDVVKVCIKENSNCCAIKEFAVPACLNAGCEIFNLSVQTGDCTSNTSYQTTINFEVQNPTTSQFELWANGTSQGLFNLSALPLTLNNFPYNGGPNDVVKVCVKGNPNCCREKEFAVPACIHHPEPCEISNLIVETGECLTDSTFKIKVRFDVANPTNTLFEAWADNGQYLGYWPISSLPMIINNFPFAGCANFSSIKVCINDNPNCCRTIEFERPTCAQGNDCSISDLVVQTTPCLCGKFFALLSFKYVHCPGATVDIGGNGVLYGNFSYTPQPIVIGPLAGDNSTFYEFVVKDHQTPGCKDVYELGKVHCPESPTFELPNPAQLLIAPNPAQEWISITTQYDGGAVSGPAVAKLFSAEGRQIRSVVVQNASGFSLQVGDLPSGTYQLVLETDLGMLKGVFFKG